MTVTCYPSPGKRKAAKMCRYFAAGCIHNGVKARIAPAGCSTLAPRSAAFFYGWTEHTAPLINECGAEGRDWYYADNAYYFGRSTYFRVTRNALMHDGRPAAGEHGRDRFERFGLEIIPWRKGGRHVVVATQSELFYRMKLGHSRASWTAEVVRGIEAATDRPIEVCHKPAPRDMARAQAHAPKLESLLEDAWALVTHSSSASVAALIRGVPVFCLAPCMSSRMGLMDLAKIEEPVTPDGRERWAWALAANQWTYREMATGQCWRELQAQSDL
ncbi:MAG: hypothetical protein ACE5JZ_06570 [Kiloniellales bacterium]